MTDKTTQPTDIKAICRFITDSDARIVLLSGISGSGKTHLAKMLEKEKFTRLSVDAFLMAEYGKEFKSFEPERQRMLTAEAESALAERMATEVKKGKRVVIDSCLCKRSKRDFMRRKAQETGHHTLLIYMQASFDESLRRLKARKGEGCDDIPVSEEMLRRFFCGFERPDEDENAILVVSC